MYCLNRPDLRCIDGGIHVHAGHIFSSSSRRQQQERQGPPGVFLLWLHTYFVGLVLTVLVMHTFKAAQPALLYLVPACLGTPITLALIRGEISALFK